MIAMNGVSTETAMTLNDWATLAGLVAAIAGVILGVINFALRFLDRRARLHVVPKVAFDVGSGMVLTADRLTSEIWQCVRSAKSARLCVDITNLSDFPVTVARVGFSRGRGKKQLTIQVPDVTPATKSWPPRLEPRESCTLFAAPAEGLDKLPDYGPIAFCETDCGCRKYGTSPIIKQLVRKISEANAIPAP